MPDLELALLRLPQPVSEISASLRTTVLNAKSAVEALTSVHPQVKMRYYTQLEDSRLLYIVASWPSARAHYDTWIPTAENQRMMSELTKEGVGVLSFVHVAGLSLEDLPSAGLVGVERYSLAQGNGERTTGGVEGKKTVKDEFERLWTEKVGGSNEASGSQSKASGGWVVEQEEGTDLCWVSFSSSKSVDQHEALRDSGTVREFPSEVKHMKVAEI